MVHLKELGRSSTTQEVGISGAVLMVRGRHRAEEDEPDEDESPAVVEAEEEQKEPVAAGSASKWAYKG